MPDGQPNTDHYILKSFMRVKNIISNGKQHKPNTKKSVNNQRQRQSQREIQKETDVQRYSEDRERMASSCKAYPLPGSG